MKQILLICLMLTFVITVKAQIAPLNTTMTYYQQKASLLPTVDTTNFNEGESFVGFKRWEWFWEPRVYGHGDFNIARTAIQNFANTVATGCTNTPSNFNWQSWGPAKNVGLASGNGQIRGIAIDPDNGNTWYVASRYGGVFVTYDAGVNWQNFFTDNLPMTTCQDIQIAKDGAGNKYLFIPTGNMDLPAYAVYRYNLTASSGWINISNGIINNNSSDPWVIDELLVNPVDPNIIFAATDKGVLQSILRCYSIKTDPTARAQVEAIAISGNDGCISAQAILKKVFRTTFEEEMLFPSTTGARVSNEENKNVVELTNDIKVYPNPAHNILTIEISSDNTIETGYILLSNLEGKQYKRINIGANNQITELDISDVPAGVYMIRVNDGKGLIITKKIVILK